jgi:tRNA(Ile)-lysidine synthase
MLIDKLLTTAKRFDMFSPGDKVVAAVSGGMDSVVMLHALHSLRNQLQISLHIAHFNHGIREVAADEDADFVLNLAKSLGIPFSFEKANVPALAREWKLGTEETARKVRYGFLNQVADDIGATKIATAHTASDVVETVMMNIMRGTVRDRIVRPLIRVFRDEIERYIWEHNLSFREDETNIQTIYTRNRIRHELIPDLRTYNPNVDDAILRLADTAMEDNELAEQVSVQAYASMACREDDSISFPLPQFISQQKAVQRRCLRIAVSDLMGSLVDIGFTHVENLLSRLDDPGVYEVELPQGKARARKTDDSVSVYLIKPEKETAKVGPRRLGVPGQVEVPELGLVVSAETLTPPVDWRRPRGSWDIVIDADKIEGILTVRTWLPGDRIVPLGMSESKKLQDIFIDRKIPKSDRSKTLVVADEEKILWVAGVVISQEVAVTEDTEIYVRLAVSRL